MSGAGRAGSGASREGSERTCVVGATALGATALGAKALGATARDATLASSERPACASAVVAQHASCELEQSDVSVEVGSGSVPETVVGLEPEPKPEPA